MKARAMRLRVSFCAGIVVLSGMGCPNPEPASKSPALQGSNTPPATPASPVKGKPYALVVSFMSPGTGTDQDAAKRLDDLVAATQPTPLRASGSWGKEGEHDECFDLAELDAKAKAAFITAVTKDVAGPSQRVHVSETAECRSR